MTKITPELFAFACYQVLMANGKGLIDKNPNYMLEKMALLELDWDAFALLDHDNKRTVIRWLMEWRIEVPDEIRAFMEGMMTVDRFLPKKWFSGSAPDF